VEKNERESGGAESCYKDIKHGEFSFQLYMSSFVRGLPREAA
jgi:hypothetical protein